MKDNEKIIYLHRYPPEDEAIQFPAFLSLIKMLNKRFSVIYIGMTRQKTSTELKKYFKIVKIPLKIDRTNTFDKWLKTFAYYLYLPFIIKKIKRINPSIIICKETLPFIPSIIGRIRIPMLIDISDWWWSIMLGKRKIGRKISKLIERAEIRDWARLNTVLIVHTKAEANMVIKSGFPEIRTRIVNAPSNKEKYRKINASKFRKRLNLADKKVVAVHGIIHPSKGYEQLISWWSKIVKKHPNWILIIIGGGGQEKLCKKLIKKLGIERNILMTGWLPSEEDVNLYLNMADCLLVTRRNTWENQGVIPSSLYHSMIIGKPTLATGLPGMSEIIKDGFNGYLYKPDDYNSFLEKLENIFKNKKNSLLVGRRGIKKAEECFDTKKSVKGYLNSINFLLKN